MKMQRLALTAAFTITCFTVPVLQASAAAGVADGQPAATRPGTTPVRPDNAGGVGGGTENRPEWSRGALATEIRDLQAQFRKEQKELMQKYQELLRAARDASAEERAKLRTQLREDMKTKLDELIAKQKELRTELKERFTEHQELIDAAKEKAKEKVRERRGNSGE